MYNLSQKRMHNSLYKLPNLTFITTQYLGLQDSSHEY
jgi:hypothetical protein